MDMVMSSIDQSSSRNLAHVERPLMKTRWEVFFLGVLIWSGGCFDHRPPPEQLPEPPREPKPRPPYRDDPWFEKALVEGGGVGLHARAALSPGGRLGIAYWSTDGAEGEPCEDLMIDDPPLEVKWDLHFAEWSEEGGWGVERVANPLLLGNPPGVDLDYQRNGSPLVSAIGGDAIPDLRYCGGGELTVYTRSSDPESTEWDREVVTARSDQAMSGEPASDFGFIVGYWPSLSQGEDGSQMLVYQDVHAGSLQRDDLARADLEVALQSSSGGGWTHEVIDLGEGAGIFNQALITPEGDQLVLYYISFDAQQAERMRQGLWIARRSSEGAWEKGLLFGGPTQGQPSMISYQGGIAVAYYDPSARRPILAILKEVSRATESGAWIRISLGDLKYNEGHSPSLVELSDGRLGVTWYRCGPAELEDCRPADDAVIFAYPEQKPNLEEQEDPLKPLEGSWTMEVVESGEEALCGFSPQIVIERSGRPWIMWQCSRRVSGTGEFEYRLESARRDPFED